MHCTIVEGKILLCTEQAILSMLAATSPQDLGSRIGACIDAGILEQLGTSGVAQAATQYPGRNGQPIALRVNLQQVQTGALGTVELIAHVDTAGERNPPESEERLMQSGKLASIGQLAAGVAHEINNPIGYVLSNLSTLRDYLHDLTCLLAEYEKSEPAAPEQRQAILRLRQQVDYESLLKDLPTLLEESREGMERVRKIVSDLRDFSRAGHSEDWSPTDINRGIEAALAIAWNDLKYKCTIERHFADLPPVEALPSQLNQVFLNILVNAGQAMDQGGTIRISTRIAGDSVVVEIADSGKGISKENLSRIFEPFFTTKEIGRGTGLGLSVSYGIIQKHEGRLEVDSQVGVGSVFRITLPIKQTTRG
jgi:two-component system, NtrC family, sensor kinase